MNEDAIMAKMFEAEKAIKAFAVKHLSEALGEEEKGFLPSAVTLVTLAVAQASIQATTNGIERGGKGAEDYGNLADTVSQVLQDDKGFLAAVTDMAEARAAMFKKHTH